jgi:hypothetical protein
MAGRAERSDAPPPRKSTCSLSVSSTWPVAVDKSGEGIVVQDRDDEWMVAWRGGCDVGRRSSSGNMMILLVL